LPENSGVTKNDPPAVLVFGDIGYLANKDPGSLRLLQEAAKGTADSGHFTTVFVWSEGRPDSDEG
jgi:hypothetical protein